MMQKTTLLRRLLLNKDVSCVHVNNQQTFVLNEVKTCLLRRALMSKDVYSKPTHACSLFPTVTTSGVFLVKTKNAFAPVKRDNSVNTYSRISTVPCGSERSE